MSFSVRQVKSVILCVTPNPAVDRTLLVPGFQNRGVFRTYEKVIAAGGKGINVARAIRVLGGESLCAGFLGGHAGRHIAEMAEAEGLPGIWTQIENETRTCVIIADPQKGHTSVVNEQGPQVTQTDWERLQNDILNASKTIDTVCFSGSLPPGSPIDAFVDLLQSLHNKGKQVWVDTSGQPLEAALTVPGINIKINDHELAEIVDKSLDNPSDIVKAAKEIRTGRTVVITLGSQGALMVHESGQWHVRPPALNIVSAVGSGDCVLAGLVVALSKTTPAEALRQAVAAGSANALSPGGGNFDMGEYRRILEQTTCVSIK